SAHARPGLVKHCGKVLVTYLAVLVASVFFRAPSLKAAVSVLAGMVGLNGVDSISVSAFIIEHLGAAGQNLVALGVISYTQAGVFADAVSHVVSLVCLYVIVW